LTGAVDFECVLDCGKSAQERNRPAQAEHNRVVAGTGCAVAVGGIGLRVGVGDRLAQGAQMIAGGARIEQRIDGYRVTRVSAARMPDH
jgi:hypothetical protein